MQKTEESLGTMRKKCLTAISPSSRMIDWAQFGGDKRGHKFAQILSNAPGLLIKLAANVSVIDRYRELHLSSSAGVLVDAIGVDCRCWKVSSLGQAFDVDKESCGDSYLRGITRLE